MLPSKKEQAWKDIAAIRVGELYENLKFLLVNNMGYIGSKEIFEDPYYGYGTTRHYFFQKDKMIVTTPAHDQLKNEKMPTTATELYTVLSELKKHDALWSTACIPIAQSNAYFASLATRRHFTLLVINKNPEDQVSFFTHYDSKGLLSKPYPLDSIRECLTKSCLHNPEKGNFKLHAQYLGVQNAQDNNSCGYFVLSFIHHIVANHDSTLQQFPKKQDEAYKKIYDIRKAVCCRFPQEVDTEPFTDLSAELTEASDIASTSLNSLRSNVSAVSPYQGSSASAVLRDCDLDVVQNSPFLTQTP